MAARGGEGGAAMQNKTRLARGAARKQSNTMRHKRMNNGVSGIPHALRDRGGRKREGERERKREREREWVRERWGKR